MAGKGSWQRPSSVPKKVFDSNWDRAFGKKKKDDKNGENENTGNTKGKSEKK
jgi:hypothetical protein